MNTGHGHVYPRSDGVRARCGGPACCHECARDLACQQQEEREAGEPTRQNYEISPDHNRCVVSMPFGIACYVGTADRASFEGRHVGVVGTDAEAQAFLRGEDVPLIRIWPDEQPTRSR